MPLERELAYFDVHRDELLQHHRGQFALIHDDQLLGAYTMFDEAFDVGIQRVGNHPFLIKQVTEDDLPVQFPALVAGLIGAHL